MIVADDENNVLSVYDRNNSGLLLKNFPYGSNLNLPDVSGGAPREVDVEAVVASIAHTGRSYWMGSMSNKSSSSPFDARPNRDRIFAVTTTGTGSSTAFNFVGYAQLRSQIVSWGNSNHLGLSASAANGKDPKQIDGFNLEGMAFAPIIPHFYLGFRAPLLPTTNRVNALIVPIQNFESWFGNGSPSGNPVFGLPILLNLQGRGIRDIYRQTANRYIIVAGDYDDAGALTSKVFSWNGNAADAPVELTGYNVANLNPEGILPVYNNTTLESHSLQFISDVGSVEQYNDGTASKDLTINSFKKFRSDVLVDAITPLPIRFANFSAIRTGGNAVNVRWTVASPDAGFYDVERSVNGADFQSVRNIKADKSQTEYEFTDTLADLHSVVYYRIKSTDLGGQAFYTNLQQVRFDKPVMTITLYPNPVKNEDAVLYCEGIEPGSQYVINRLDGSVVARGILQNGVRKISVGQLSAGIYSLKVLSGSEVKTLSFIKE